MRRKRTEDRKQRTKSKKHILFAFILLWLVLAQGITWADASILLQPGAGFTEPTLEPGPIGTPGEESYDAKAIARWDVVPYQVINDAFEIGVVAFHMINIDRIEFSVEGGPWQAVDQMAVNPRTGVNEYWAVLDATTLPDGLIEVRAIAYPTVGQPRLLDSLFLYTNAGGTLTEHTVYVSTTGNDSNPGTMSLPMRTITNAIDTAGDGGRIIILEEGLYELHMSAKRAAFDLHNERYVTVEAAAGLNRDNVIIGWPTRQTSRPKVDKMHFKNISFDFSTIDQYYGGEAVWFDNSRWYQSEGWTAEYDGQIYPVRANYYATDSLAEDMLYGFVKAKLIRNSAVRKLSGDAYANSEVVLNSQVTKLGAGTGFHNDIWQIFQYGENFIVYGLEASGDIIDTQAIFLDHYQSTHTDYAVVNVNFNFSYTIGGPPFTQFNAPSNHLVFRNVKWPGQKIIFRTDFDCIEFPTNCRQFIANNVLFENCELYPEDFDRYVLGKYSYGTGTPEGVTFKDCYPAGEAPPIFLYGDINGNGEVTSYDAALAARYAVGLEVFTDEQRQKADVSANGEVSAYDAALIAQKAEGLIDRFPVEEELPSFSLAKLWNWIKGLLTKETGQAILSGRITGNAMNEIGEDRESKVPYIILALFVAIMLIIVIIIVKIKKSKEKAKKKKKDIKKQKRKIKIKKY